VEGLIALLALLASDHRDIPKASLSPFGTIYLLDFGRLWLESDLCSSQKLAGEWWIVLGPNGDDREGRARG
jgi:hypothetical protein